MDRSPGAQKLMSFHLLEEIRKGLSKDQNVGGAAYGDVNKICPCISDEAEMLDIFKNKLISYPLHATDNRGQVHEATVTTVGNQSGDTSTIEPFIPRIKIIDCTEGLGGVQWIDVHSTNPWILVSHDNGNVSIWNRKNQTRVMAFHNIANRGEELGYIMKVKFIEPSQCFVAGDDKGYIHVYSYEKEDKLKKFKAHADWVFSIDVHPSEPFVLSAYLDSLIKLWNWETGWQCIRTFEDSHPVYNARFNPQTAGNTFASSSADTKKIWSIHSPSPITTLDRELRSGNVCCLDYFTPSGDKKHLVTGSWSGDAKIWDLQTKKCIKKINGLQDIGRNIGVVENLTGRPILLTISMDHTVAYCDSTTHRYENRVNFNLGNVEAFAYINMTKSLVFGCAKGIAIMEID